MDATPVPAKAPVGPIRGDGSRLLFLVELLMIDSWLLVATRRRSRAGDLMARSVVGPFVPWRVPALVGLMMLAVLSGGPAPRAQADDFVPRRQSKPPGPALPPEVAVASMTPPEGFTVEVLASEPDIVNPVAMTFDERGRVWICESLEYPRREPGPGRDRIKVCEDTTGDGKLDKFTIFADGLNIPSGIAVGYGGVWVANSPDILFLQDTDGDDVADTREVVVTGFGRDDTHELPNTLTWGPDGRLYGLNGVFNPSRVEQDGRVYQFTCAVWRIDPITRKFDLFCEGTSNPWGIGLDHDGSMFVSACVIDHLWHLVETGYYIRQGGPYPPYTWPIGSIVEHKHQLAAYCGLHYYDSDAYPVAYRNKLYMGNIHGNCLNTDVLARRGSTYQASPGGDLLSANDVWFMPVSQQTGPDGCLYILDWYDRYHCYQDANRDPDGVDRTKGRLYRLAHHDSPSTHALDLAKETDEQLVVRLSQGNGFVRTIAQRLLQERGRRGELADTASRLLVTLATDPEGAIRAWRASVNATRVTDIPNVASEFSSDDFSRTARHALFAIIGGGPLPTDVHQTLLTHADPIVRAWGVRAAGNMSERGEPLAQVIVSRIVGLAEDDSPDVRLQVVIAAPKIDAINTVPTLMTVLNVSGDDPLIPQIVWANLHPRLEESLTEFVAGVRAKTGPMSRRYAELLTRAVERIGAARKPDLAGLAGLFAVVAERSDDPKPARDLLAALTAQVQSGTPTPETRNELRTILAPALEPMLARLEAGEVSGPVAERDALPVIGLAAIWGDERALTVAAKLVQGTRGVAPKARIEAVRTLVAAGRAPDAEAVVALLRDIVASDEEHRAADTDRLLSVMGEMSDPAIADTLLAAYGDWPETLQPTVVDLLTQRVVWTGPLLASVEREDVPKSALNATQLRRLASIEDASIQDAIKRIYGTIRASSSEQRQLVIGRMRRLVHDGGGDPHRGWAAYDKICGQCHKLHGRGVEVGPDITRNGRNDFEQLLSNIFDPSLVIGPGYESRLVATADGRVVSGLVVEEGPNRIVLKLQGGKLETFRSDDIDEMKRSNVSLMPDEIERQLTPAEWKDLFALLTLDRPPTDPEAGRLAGAEPLDAATVSLPSDAVNHLAQAKLTTNVSRWSDQPRGEVRHVVWSPPANAFLAKSQWHEVGVPFGQSLGVVSEDEPFRFEAIWDRPVSINTITLSGCYPNQPQPKSAWSIEVRLGGEWTEVDRGVGGWIDAGRYVWGAPTAGTIAIEGFRVNVFSPDDQTPVTSLHFRGEPEFSWFVGQIPSTARLR